METIFTGNEDNLPHFSYYHEESLRSFVMNERSWPYVMVSEGGYGEPPIDSYNINDYLLPRAGNLEKVSLQSFASSVQGYLLDNQQRTTAK